MLNDELSLYFVIGVYHSVALQVGNYPFALLTYYFMNSTPVWLPNDLTTCLHLVMTPGISFRSLTIIVDRD